MKTDEQIKDFIKKLEEQIETADARRQNAFETWQFLKDRFESAFTLDIWDSLSMLEIGRRREEGGF